MRTGCFVKMCQSFITTFLNGNIFSSSFKKLTFVLFCLCIFTNEVRSFSGEIFGQEKSSTYLRWNLFSQRDQLSITKSGHLLTVKTLNSSLYESLKFEFSNSQFDQSYIGEVRFLGIDNKTNAYTFEVKLKNENVEVFSFYREREKKYVVDFWVEGDQGTISQSIATPKKDLVKEVNFVEDKVELKIAQKNPIPSSIIKKTAPKIGSKERKISNISSATPEEEKVDVGLVNKVNEDKVLSSLVFDPKKLNILSEEEMAKVAEDSKKPYRDFRYGTTLIWDYNPIIPAYKGIVNTKTKIPEHFYPIPNRDFKKNEKETHLQLTINLYRKKKWGLMYKSIKLFQTKFGASTEQELIEFLKVNAILRENIDAPNPELFKNAINTLSVLVEKSDNYEMKKAIYKYLLSYYFERGETLKTLQIAKNYYAGTRDNFDFEESIIPAEALLNTLAKMGQIEKIRELAQEKTMKKILPAQLLLAYQSYGHLKSGDLNGLVQFYEKVKPSLVKPIDPVILYNTAEAMFRLGRFQEAINMYQEFISNYSYEFVASEASLRIALCSDLLDKNYDETLKLYKKAIDTALSADVNYEARIRYVAFRTIRKKVLDESDLETRIFLEQDKRTEGKPLEKNLQRLLQQVRLRTLIVDGKYKEALAYLSLIPMITMSKIEARSFDGDGAEIVFGLISDFYKKAEYTQAIKVWQNYKDKYLDKVALDPYINFIVGSSYVKLGLFKGFDEIYSAFLKLKDEPNRTFPIWVNRDNTLKASDLLAELAIVKDIKLKNWDLVSKNLNVLEKKMPDYNKINYYRGIVSFQQRNYKEASKDIENFLSKESSKAIYDPQELADMIRAYTDSIYELGQTDKFLKVSEAILSDTNSVGIKNAYILNVRERIAYLGIEITKSQSEKGNNLALEKKIMDFKKENPKSIYLGRINLILGQSYIQNKKMKEGKELLSSLVNDNTVSDYIKELAKSELSLLNLKEQTL